MSSPQYFAQIDENNIVVNIAVVTKEFMEQNPDRYPGVWVETFVGVSGKTYAGVGYIYDETLDNFVAPVYVPQAPYIEVPEP
jgi:hypothetical protein